MADPNKILGGLGKLKKALTVTYDEARLAELMSNSGDKTLPLMLPRANLSSDFINQQAERVARQMLGEHVVSGKPKETFNLAGRSKKESQRVKGLDYKLSPIGTVAEEVPYTPRRGDMKVAFPGDQTVSNKVLEEVNGFPIDSVQEGGAYYGLGQKHLPVSEFWKSNEVPAKGIQGKIDRAAELFEPDRVIGSHLAMGPTSNNFAMHFADANLRAVDWSKAEPKKINQFDSIIANGYKDPKTGELVTFPHWPGLADREGALAAMKNDSDLRKWVNNRFKTPSVTQPLGLPNGLDIEYAITEPRIRDMEINMTGLMTGELKPGSLVEAAGNPHNTYTHRILGEAGGPQEVLTPFVIDFPDAAQHIASTKRPSDFTGTIQKVFPHQLVDDQYINQYNQYRQRIKELTGQKKGGAIDGEDHWLTKVFKKREEEGMGDGGVPHMADAGRVGKGAAKVFKKMFADEVPMVAKRGVNLSQKLFANSDVLPAMERQVNLEKFLAPSAEKRRMYHGSKEPNIKEFKTRKDLTDESHMTGHYADERDAVFLAPEPEFTKNFSQMGYTDTHQAPTTYPVYVQVENPFDFDNPEHLGKVKETYLDMYHNPDSDLYDPHMLPSERSMAIHTFNKRVDNLPNDENNWARIENQDFQDVLKDLGFDSFYTRERGTKNLGVYEPNRIKSAIGNRGTYELGDPDINKAKGGLLHMADAGRVVKGLGKVAKMFVDPSELTPIVKRGTRKFGDEIGGNSIIKETGGNWLGGDATSLNESTVEKQLKRFQMGDTMSKPEMEKLKNQIESAKKVAGNTDVGQRLVRNLQADFDINNRNNVMNAWRDSNLTNYVKKQMGTADDPVRKLAEQGVLHMTPYGNGESSFITKRKRVEFGYPEQGIGQSPEAQFWERISDQAIDPFPASAYKYGSLEKSILTDNPWLQNVPDESIINSSKGLARELGFGHILDVLRQDLRDGRIRPEQLSKVSMEQAVRRTHEYDQEMAKKMRETQAKVTEGMPTHKDYPDKGYKWIELTEPKELPNGWSQESSGVYLGPDGERTIINPARQNLESALKYEGDTMGHCVGSYCDDVAGGKSRIFSLRDSKGEPHVTIEVNPASVDKGTFPVDTWFKSQPQEVKDAITSAGYTGYNIRHSPQFKEAEKFAPPLIKQIKGKQNAKPKEEYLPFVQDFVKSGEWSDVGDFRNTGLVKRDGKYLTPEEDSDWLLKQLGTEGMAQGGVVFKKIQFMDKGGLTTSGGSFSPEELGVGADEIGLSEEQRNTFKRNAPIVTKKIFDETKKTLSDDYDRLRNSDRARAQYAKILAAQAAGSLSDSISFAVSLGLDPLKSVTIDKLLTKPRPRSVLEGPYNPNSPVKSEHERVPMFGSISDALKTEDGLPIGGSEHMIKRAQEAGLMYGKTTPVLDEEGYPLKDSDDEPLQYTSGRFSLPTEIGGAILSGSALSKLGRLSSKGYKKYLEPRVHPAGALSRAINADSDAMFNPNFRTR